MGSYPILAVNFQLTVNDDEVGIYPAFSELRTLREGREAKQENFSEKTSPELKPKDKRTVFYFQAAIRHEGTAKGVQ